MTSCVSSSSRRVGAALVLGFVFGLSGCAGGGHAAVWPGHEAEKQPLRIALLPPEDLTDGAAPLREIELVAERALAKVGIEVVSGALVDEFLARHRIRYTGGLDREGARAARAELGVSAAMITSVVLYGEIPPPRFGVLMRLVSAADEPEILWMDGFGRTGDDSPGLLGLGNVASVRKLQEEAFNTTARSLAAFMRDARRRSPSCETSQRFAPRVAFRSPSLARKEAFTVAVLPFVNESGRRGAGQVLALEMARQLLAVGGVRVIEPGMLREELLTYRVTSEGGATLPTVRLLSKVLKVDLVVGGTVRDYDEQLKTPLVDFSAITIDPATEEAVWESTSHNLGDDAMSLFGAGTISTANALACRMVNAAVVQMVRRRPARRANAGALAQRRRRHTRSAQALRCGRRCIEGKPLS
jgi:TolB-like protein